MSDAEQVYFVRWRGEIQGPFTTEQLHTLASQGQVSRLYDVSADQVRWQRLEAIPELYAPYERIRPAATEQEEPADTAPASEEGLVMPESPADSKEWYYSTGDTVNGPCTTAELRHMISTGRLGFADYVSLADDPEAWQAIAEVPEFNKAARANVGTTIHAEHKPESSQPNTVANQVLGLIGSAMLLLGVFMPIISVPIFGSINYFRNGEGDGVFVLVLGLASILLVLLNKYQWLFLTGIGALGVMAFTFVNVYSKLAEAKSSASRDLAGNPFKGLADAAIESIQFEWGWGVLVLGAILLIAAAIVEPKKTLPGI